MSDKKKNRFLKHIVIFIISLIFMLAIPVKLKVEIDNPNVNMQMFSISENGEKEIGLKRFFENKIFCNIDIDEVDSEIIRIKIVEDKDFIIKTVRVAVNNYIFLKITDFQSESIKVNDLVINENQEFLVVGENPYIEFSINGKISHYIFYIRIMYCFFVFIIIEIMTYLFSILKKKQITCKKIYIVPILFILLGVLFLMLGYNKNQGYIYAELAFLISAFGIVLRYMIDRKNSNSELLVCIVVVLFLLGMSVHEITTFLTVDELRSIEDQYLLQSTDMYHWYSNVGRINYVIMGTLWIFIPNAIVQEGMLQYQQVAKLLHWIVGIGLIAYISSCIQKKILKSNKEHMLWDYMVIFCGIMLIPLTQTALKNYNYDLFSLLFGLLGIIYLIEYCQRENTKAAIIAFICLSAAMSEKIIAMPAWLIGMCVLISVNVNKKNKNTIAQFIWCARDAIIVLISAMVLFWISQIYVFSVLLEEAPIYTFSESVKYMCALPSMGVDIIIKTLGMQISEAEVSLFCGISLFLGLWIVSFIIIKLVEIGKQSNRSIIIFKCVDILSLAFIITGIIANYFSIDYTASRILYFLFYCSSFIRAVPTLFLIVFIGVLVYYFFNFQEKNIMEIVGGIDLFFSTLFFMAVKSENFIDNRYYNLYIIIFCISVIVMMLQIVRNISITKQAVGYGIIGILSFFEINSSQPAFSYFIPLWDTVGTFQSENGVDIYWGEQWAVVGKRVKEYCLKNEIKTNEVTLYCGYTGGTWLTAGECTIGDRSWMWKPYECSTTKNDFYAFETSAVNAHLIPNGFPVDVKPVITLYYRGKVSARIYQGSDLINYFSSY